MTLFTYKSFIFKIIDYSSKKNIVQSSSSINSLKIGSNKSITEQSRALITIGKIFKFIQSIR